MFYFHIVETRRNNNQRKCTAGGNLAQDSWQTKKPVVASTGFKKLIVDEEYRSKVLEALCNSHIACAS
jgi:hypothetical protein